MATPAPPVYNKSNTVMPLPEVSQGANPAGYAYAAPGIMSGPVVNQNPSIINQPSQSTNTTVVINQPDARAVAAQRGWSTGLWDCCDNIGICCCGIFCCCCLECKVADDMNESMCVPCCVPNSLVVLRVKMRTQEQIPGSIMDDNLVSSWCGPCTLCQLAREADIVKNRRRGILC